MQMKFRFFSSFPAYFLFFTAADNHLYDVLCKNNFDVSVDASFNPRIPCLKLESVPVL